ncbi:MAG: MnmC family methyltransferase [Pseudobdellovibrionaceae bacterium]
MAETTDFWKKHNYEKVLTEDQSPTLRWLGSETQETMHHRGGAYSETQLIYGNPLRESLELGGRSAVSVGLGLGYNEILVALEALKRGIGPSDFQLLSFESDSFLREHFLFWTETSDTDLIYDEIFLFFDSPLKPEVKKWLFDSYKNGSWKVEGALLPEFSVESQYEVIFYDAFSSKTSPHLWDESFLTRFFSQVCAPASFVSTYACTGALKRALKANDFEVVIREGFQSKRNSTLGVRPLLKAP